MGKGDKLTDEDCPDIDECKQNDVGNLVQGENEWENVIGYALSETVKRVESMAGVRGGHNPLVMRFMKGLVDSRMMQASMNPIYEEVGEGEEKGELDKIVEPEGRISRGIVQFGISSNFAHEKRNGEDGHDGKSNACLLYLQANLIFEVFGMGEGGVVKDEKVGE